MGYKDEQKETRKQLHTANSIGSGGSTVNLGINKFKRENKGSRFIQTYKENAWKSYKEK